MSAEKQDRAVCVENVLRAVAVMNIPVNDRYAPQSKLCLSVPGCNRNRVKKAKSHAASRGCVVPGRASQTECILHGVRTNGIHCVQCTSHGISCGLGRLTVDRGVASAQLPSVLRHFALDKLDIPELVHQRQFVICPRPGLEEQSAAQQSR